MTAVTVASETSGLLAPFGTKTVSVSHTVTAATALAVLICAQAGALSLTAVTYNGVALTLVRAEAGHGVAAAVYAYVYPGAAPVGTFTCVVTSSDIYDEAQVFVVSLNAADSAALPSAGNTASHTGSSNPYANITLSDAVTIPANALALDGITLSDRLRAFTAAGAQVQLEQKTVSSNTNGAMAVSSLASGSSMGWTWASGTDRQVAHAILVFPAVAVADTTPPTMTGSMTSSGVTATGFTIDWSGTTRADNVAITGYEYSTDAGSTWSDAGNVTLKAFTGKTASTAYTTLVRAYDAAANKSTPALSITVTTSASGDTTLPTQSGSITASAITSSGFTMSWPAGSDNVAVTGYEVSTDGGTTYASVGNVLTTNVTGKAASTAYPCRVRCFDAAGNRSTPALSATITTSAPATYGFLSDAWTNGATSLWAPGTVVNWSWYPAGRIGSLAGITPAQGTSVLDSASKAAIAGLSAAGAGVLLGAVRVTSATDDNVFYQAATAA